MSQKQDWSEGSPPTHKESRLRGLLARATEQLREERLRRSEGIAIVGIGCRLPGGADSPARLMRLLEDGVDAVTAVPPSRWDNDAIHDPHPDTPGRVYTRGGGFLSGVDQFEPEVFGIAPREAASLDPQQRLLLEVAWEACEDAGLAPRSLKGSSTGVWVGLGSDDYGRRFVASEQTDGYAALGTSRSIAAGRIAYCLGLQGPTLQLDTACSSSLVAVHLASQSLRARECDAALVGGVQLMLSPESSMALCRLRALSPDDQCRAFDASANGYVRGEGCGMVVLKRLRDAVAAGDRIYAVVAGSAINHDGRSNGLTAPNARAQQAVLRSALASAGLEPGEVDFVETHGTGTPLGDPIEASALAAVYGERAPDAPLWLGAIKTNLGHLEAAAGIAGLIKVALCLHYRRLVPSLHFRRPNPRVRWDEWNLSVNTAARDWPLRGTRRAAAVSSFGISGTNAHAVVQEAPAVESRPAPPVRSAELVVLSARTPASLRQYCEQLAGRLSEGEPHSLVDMAYSQARSRATLLVRASVAASDTSELRDGLMRLASGEGHVAEAVEPAPRVVFVFPGQGSQWLGMGRELLGEEAVFRQAIEHVDAAIRHEAGWSVLEQLLSDESTSRLSEIDVVQPLLFAVQVALAATWRSWGVEPSAVVGHSMGEVGAAYVAGALSLDDAVAIICRRSRLLRTISGRGAMALIELSLAEAEAELAGYESLLSVAVSNGSRSTVISGEPEALEEVLTKLEARKVFCRRVKVDVASHSPQVDPLLEDLSEALTDVVGMEPRVPMLSTVTGEAVQRGTLTAGYWCDNLRQPVRFGRVVEALLAEGPTHFVEVSPHPLLGSAIEELRQQSGQRGATTGSLRREARERRTMLEALGQLHVEGSRVDVERLFPAGAQRVPLPAYPWQRRRFWHEASVVVVGVPCTHALLGRRLSSAGRETIFELSLSTDALPWLRDHRVGERIVVPAALIAEVFRGAGEEHGEGAAVTVHDLVISRPLVVEEQGARRVQLVVSPECTNATLHAESLGEAGVRGWELCASAQLRPAQADGEAPCLDIAELTARCPREVSVEELYEGFADAGLDYGPSFRGLVRLRAGEGEAVAEVELPGDLDTERLGLHPALLDAAFHSAGALLAPAGDRTRLPVRLSYRLLGPSARRVFVHASRSAAEEASATIEVRLYDEEGRAIAAVDDLQLRTVDLASLGGLLESSESRLLNRSLFELRWFPVPAPEPGSLSGRTFAVVCQDDREGEELCEALRAHGGEAQRVEIAQLPRHAEREWVLLWSGGDDGSAAVELCCAGLDAVQAQLRGSESAPPVWWLTRAAVAATPGEEEVVPAAAGLWGLGRTVLQERPRLGLSLVDLGAADEVGEVAVRELSAGDGETQLAWRSGVRLAARLVSAEAAGPPQRPLRTQGTGLITGGLGALGRFVARHLAREGMKHLVLLSRSGESAAGAREARRELSELGARVTIASVDVSDRTSLREVITSIPSELPLRVVVHAAGTVDDGLLTDQTKERFRQVMAAKVLGGWNLHELTREADLDDFVCYSSLSGTLGSASQGGYAAANAWLDSFAAHRRALGLAGRSLAWGPWGNEGLASDLSPLLIRRLTSQGFDLIEADTGEVLLKAGLRAASHALVLAPLQLGRLRRALGVVPPLLSHLLPPSSGGGGPSRGRELSRLSPEQRRQAVLALVKREAGRVLSMSAAALGDLQSFKEAGLDSLMGLELRNAISRQTGLALPATLVFDYPHPRAVADYVSQQLSRVEAPASAAALTASTRPALATDEPIAIVGMSCRMPGGVTSPEELWEMLKAGRDAIDEVPPSRWDVDRWYDPDPEAPGKMVTRWGGFLPDIESFEPSFFGMSAREGRTFDPQGRLLLETCWEALEGAGISLDALLGSETGVFMGLMSTEYLQRLVGDVSEFDAYTLLGASHNAVVGRISYWLGLTGPNMPVDTACSSSLVATHLACQALSRGECNLALAGGANVLLAPEGSVYMSGLQALSPTGRCRAFAAEADGFVRSEGAGVVVLERLSDAIRNGHPVLALIRGSAVNQDGRSNGPTAPNGPSQRAVILQALRRAKLSPAEVDYVECHGTGTALGDPIEVQALGSVLGEGRDAERPVLLASLKSNVGHMEAAAGVGALIKTVLCLQHEEIPKSLHAERLNPHIPWQELPVEVVREQRQWPRRGRPLVAGVSSFGISGTNAHIVVEQAPESPEEPVETPARSAELVVLSARDEGSLRHYAAALDEHLSRRQPPALLSVAASQARTRSSGMVRASVTASSVEELKRGLARLASGEEEVATSVEPPPRVVFVYPGQGSQWLGMGQKLLVEEGAFRGALEEVDEAIRREAGWSVLAELSAPEEASRLSEIDVVQPVLFAMQVGLTALWQSWGIEPSAVVGHSMGEVAAAYAAGALGLADAVAIICRRSRLLKRISGRGAMGLVDLSISEAEAELAGMEKQLSVAVSNAKRSTVISGEPGALASVLEKLQERNVFCRPVKVDVASHSPQVDPLLAELEEALSQVSSLEPRVAMYSTVTCERIVEGQLEAVYWCENLRKPVRFGEVMGGLFDEEPTHVLEISAHPLLVTAVEELRRETGQRGATTGSLRREAPERRSLLDALGELYGSGQRLDCQRLFPSFAQRALLPMYPWQRQRLWVEARTPVAGRRTSHPLLGHQVVGAWSERTFEISISAATFPWLRDHRVGGRIVVPAVFIAEMFRGASEEGGAEASVRDLVISRPIVVPDQGERRLQVVMAANAGGVSLFVETFVEGEAPSWELYATAKLSPPTDSDVPTSVALPDLSSRCSEELATDELYDGFAELGLQYGVVFRGLKSLHLGRREVLARVELPAEVEVTPVGLHPALLDAALQSVGGLLARDGAQAMLPLGLSYRLFVPGVRSAFVHARLTSFEGEASAAAEVRLYGEGGNEVARIDDLRLRAADVSALGRAEQSSEAQLLARSLFAVQWRSAPAPEVADLAGRSFAVVGAEGAALAEGLRERGADVQVVGVGDLSRLDQSDWVMLWPSEGDGQRAIDACCAGLAGLQQQLQRPTGNGRLWWLTLRAQAVEPGDTVRPLGAALWGLGRTARQERPQLALTLLDAGSHDELCDAFVRELSADDGEPQVAWRSAERRVARLARSPAPAPREQDRRLVSRKPGMLDSLRWEPVARQELAEGEVEIEVRAAGLNYHDVVCALGVIDDPRPLGGECAGVVTRVGSAVKRVQPGQRVMALGVGMFRRYATIDARVVVAAPAGLSFPQAATLPAVFQTAWYALKDLARLAAGETILIHAAAGGVGMAAVQIARWIGANVIATASPPKWPVLRQMGIEHVANSRDLEFGPAFREVVGHVDVVLNSIAGEAVEVGLSLLGQGGRFIEMGKTDIRDAAEVEAAHPGIVYRAFDLGDPGIERLGEMLEELGEAIGAGHLRALPVRCYPMEEAEAAFRFVGQARHVGKLALVASAQKPRSAGTALITGGLGALGRFVARRLAREGMQHLVLVSRRGESAAEARETRLELEALGARVTVAAADVSCREELSRVIGEIPSKLPLRVVVHAAGVVDDGLLSAQTPERFRAVMAPKVLGGWHLHELTKGEDLDDFVLYSSLSGTWGSASQGGYAGANAWLDALAFHRQATGLVARSLAWGPWGSEGLASDLSPLHLRRLTNQGFDLIEADSGELLLDAALRSNSVALAIAPLRLRRLRGAVGIVPPFLRELLPSARGGAGSDRAHGLARLAPEQRREALLQLIRREVGRVLSMSAGAIGSEQSFKEAGLDSLMALELRNALSRETGLTLPATLVFDYPHPRAVAEYVSGQLGQRETTPMVSPQLRPALSEDESIAVVAMACRMPGGVDSPEALWSLLKSGGDAVEEVPATRWDIERWYDPDPEARGKMVSRWGGFLRGIESFEPGFFGMSEREGRSFDPQGRLLLEAAWEALERAGIPGDDLMGSDTGVFMGLTSTEYLARAVSDVSAFDAYSLLGGAHNAVVGRLSYWLGLKGPNMPVDTACSSSLVALHLACQALVRGECSLALAGGANVVLSPEGTVYLSGLGALSPTGRCRAFSAEADGFVRSEGAGVVVLERLSDARRQGHPVLAVIRGSAVNQDGRSNGPTAPNGPSQQAVIRQALQRAKIAAADVDYVECHGTGTALGDPIEVQALSVVLGEGREAGRPVQLASLKSNVGHMEAAAGVGALIKTVLCLQHGELPRSIHASELNPHIPWGELPVEVVREHRRWPEKEGLRVAGLSSFGISGTNAHVVVEQAPEDLASSASREERGAEGEQLFLLSARTDASLRDFSSRVRARVEPSLSLSDLSYSLLSSRKVYERRAFVVASSTEELKSELSRLERGELASAGPRRGGVVWLFSGQGAQRAGMGRELSARFRVFGRALEEACEHLDEELPHRLREVMWAPEGSELGELLHETQYTQPALFAFEWALSELWRSVGGEPDGLLGHSVGEIAAACASGVMSLRSACRLVTARGRLMQELPAGGAMVAIGASEERVRQALVGLEAEVSVAAVNGPGSVVISGVERVVERVSEQLSASGASTKRLRVSHAFHSPLMEPMLERFERVVQELELHAPRLRLVSSVTGQEAGEEMTRAEYWVKHAREAVRFGAGVQTLRGAGAEAYVELGPRSPLLSMVDESLREPVEGGDSGSQVTPQLVASQRGRGSEAGEWLTALGAWSMGGGRVQASELFGGSARRIELPTYPWERKRLWVEARAPISGERAHHPLLGRRISSAGSEVIFETALSADAVPWIEHHRVGEHIVVPAALLAELFRGAGEQGGLGPSVVVAELVISRPLILPDHGARRLQIVLSESRSDVSLYVAASDDPEREWQLLATARLRSGGAEVPRVALAELLERCPEEVPVTGLYERFAEVGIHLGASFRGMKRLRRGRGEVVAEIELPEELDTEGLGLHPALLDAGLQSAGALVPRESSRTMLPVRLSYHLVGPCVRRALVHARLQMNPGDSSASAEVRLYDVEGKPIASVEGFRLEVVDTAVLGRVLETEESRLLRRSLYEVRWIDAEVPQPAVLSGRTFAVVSSAPDPGEELVDALRASGGEADMVSTPDLSRFGDREWIFVWPSGEEGSEAVQLCLAGLEAARAQLGQQEPPRTWWLTERAVTAKASETIRPAGATLWGLGRSLQQERPQVGFKLLDVGAVHELGDALVRELAAADGETQVAWRRGERRVARLLPASVPLATSTHPATARMDGTALITGGLGALGRIVARHLAANGMRHLLLVSRRGQSHEGAKALAAELEAFGARVTVEAADVSDREAISRVVAAIPSDLPLRVVVHAAGVVDDGLLSEQTPERFRAVMGPKVLGSWHLHELTLGADLDDFVLYSSISGTLGSASQGAYSAANAWLDALAAHRRARGMVGRSLAWGPWSGQGMASELSPRLKNRLVRQGFDMIEEESGGLLLEAGLRAPSSDLVLAPLNLGRMRRAVSAVAPLLRELLPSEPAFGGPAFARELARLAPEERTQALLGVVKREVGRVLSVPVSGIGDEHSFKESGLDSLMALELINALSRQTGVTVSAKTVLDHPHPIGMAQHISDRLGGSSTSWSPAEGLASGSSTARLAVRFSLEARPAVVRHRLLCFHEAGGTSETFTRFAELADDGIEVHCASILREGLSPGAAARELSRAAVAYAQSQGDGRPLSLFGHSAGAIVAWHVAKALESQGAAPEALVCSSMNAPHAVIATSAADVEALLRRLFGVRVELMNRYREAFAFDMKVCRELLALTPSGRLAAPLLAIHAERDDVVSEKDVREWEGCTSKAFEYLSVSGRHFYLSDGEPIAALLDALRERLLR